MPDTWPQKLVGTWTLVSWEQKKGDGSKVRRYGENPVGIAFFDPGGRYIISVMRSDRAKQASAIPGQGTAEENKATAGPSDLSLAGRRFGSVLDLATRAGPYIEKKAA